MDLGIPGLEDASPIGQGGFATVYRARQPAFARTVAVKVLAATEVDEQSELRFYRELQALGKLSEHPAIVTVFDTGFTTDGRAYLTMVFVEHGTLADRLRRQGPLAWPETAEILIRLSGALETAHRSGIVHRDIKPANVLLSQYGAQLSDFGIARIAGAQETSSGVVTASLAHAAPEVLDGVRPTVTGDIYSLGSTAYAMLLGRSPFERTSADETFLSIVRRIHADAPPDLRHDDVPEDLATLLARTLAKDPASRPQSAMEFGQELQAVMGAHHLRVPELMVSSGLVGATRRVANTDRLRDDTRNDTQNDTRADTQDNTQDVTDRLVVDDPPAPGRHRRARLGAVVAVGVGLAFVLAAVGLASRNGGGGAGDEGSGGAPTTPPGVSLPPATTLPVAVPIGTAIPDTTVPAEEAPADTEVTALPSTSIATTTTLAPVSDVPVCGPGGDLLPGSGQPVPMILDTGVGVGVDDLGALAVMHALASAGEVEVLATMVSVGGDENAGRAVDAVNTYYRRPDVPIGVVSGPAPTAPSDYTAQLAGGFPSDLVAAEPAVDLYRRVLAGQPDGSVTIVSVGFLTNLADLMASPADAVSDLTGQELVAAKVAHWVAMGGAYPDSASTLGGPEFNLGTDAPAARSVISGWPVPAVFSGFEVGSEVLTGAVLQTETPPENPVREGYRLSAGVENVASFDLTAVLAAVRDSPGGQFEVCTGRNVVGGDGSTTWEHRAGGPHGYLRAVVPNEEVAATLDALLVAPPS